MYLACGFKYLDLHVQLMIMNLVRPHMISWYIVGCNGIGTIMVGVAWKVVWKTSEATAAMESSFSPLKSCFGGIRYTDSIFRPLEKPLISRSLAFDRLKPVMLLAACNLDQGKPWGKSWKTLVLVARSRDLLGRWQPIPGSSCGITPWLHGSSQSRPRKCWEQAFRSHGPC